MTMKYQRIASPHSEMETHYQVVVVGSGYGGGVAASRFARAQRKVCVLERGKEILPGEYPTDLESAQREFQVDTSRGHVGSALGLFDFRTNDDVNVLVGCGLGGTSLINANVALPMDKRQFVEDNWPSQFRDNPDLLDPYYERASAMLGAAPYPAPQQYPEPNKLKALRRSAQYMNEEHNFSLPPLNVNYVNQINRFGVPQPACNQCGDCTSGCNVGAKNTILMNYLPDAAKKNAKIFTHTEVDYIEKVSAGWRVHVRVIEEDSVSAPIVSAKTIDADMVVLAAGSLGSTEILLRSAERGLSLSSRLGEGFSGNGDVLGFGYNCYWQPEETPIRTGIKEAGAKLRKLAGAALPHTPGDEIDYSGILNTVTGLLQNGKSQPLRQEIEHPEQINGFGIGANVGGISSEKRPGPCITGIIDLRDNEDPSDRLVIEEGVIPSPMARSRLLPPMLMFGSMLEGDFFRYGAVEGEQRLKDAEELSEMLKGVVGVMKLGGACYEGATGRTQTYLVMSKDDAGGRLSLGATGRVRVQWTDAGKSPVIERDNTLLKLATEGVHGQYINNPLWSKAAGRKLVTVHPLGGCKMADSAEEGVVNHACEVFQGSGEAVHDGLFVCDGAVLPASVGVNPLLTITAVAERACELAIKARKWPLDDQLNPPELLGEESVLEELQDNLQDSFTRVTQWVEDAGDVSASGFHSWWRKKILGEDTLPHRLSFGERMSGWFTTELSRPDAGEAAERFVSSSYELASRIGRVHECRMVADFLVDIPDLDDFEETPNHPGRLTATITCPALGGGLPMKLTDGEFELLRADVERVETWEMNYQGTLVCADNRKLTFTARKILDEKADSHWWTDVTTLFVDVLDHGQILGQGILELSLEDLIHQASTIEIEPTTDLGIDMRENDAEKYRWILFAYIGGFAKVFGMTIMNAYGGLLANLNNFASDENSELRKMRRVLRAPDAKSQQFDHFKLTRFQGGFKGPVILAPGFGVTAGSFATRTVRENLVEYLCAANYDVWLFDYRASPDSGCATKTFDIDDIVDDWQDCVTHIRAETGAADVQVVAHCVGAMTLLMSLLAGLDGVRSAVCSQLTLHPVTDWLNYLKADLELVNLLDVTKTKTVDIRSGNSEEAKAIDTMLYRLPTPEGEECNNPVCHRIFSVFGPSYTHAQLNHETHVALEEMFGEISTVSFKQLAEIIRNGHVVDRNGNNVYLPHVDRLALPLSFMAGEKNQIFFPETSARTLSWLEQHNDPSLYDRRVFQNYAHMDFFVGRDAAEIDGPYEYVLEQLERYPSGTANE